MSNSAPHPGSGGIAVITGASSGLGAAFAREFARRGHDLVLVARRRKRLEILAAEAAVKHGVTAEIIPADLSVREDLDRVVDRVQSQQSLRFLVNAAGFGLEGPFSASDIAQQQAMIDVHVVASVRLVRAALPVMLAQHAGAIVNIASLGAFAPLPGFATYGATKAYMVSFTRSLAIELEGTGVHVQALCPGFTHTEFQERQGADLSRVPKMMWMSAEQAVAASLRALQNDQVVCVPGFLNRIAARLAGPFGEYIQRRVAPQNGWITAAADEAQAAEEGAAPRQAR
ncbi:MAG: SDR family oxidoreductase [Chloroflexi bacterium]|nr:SDR family oxidoreductase [Chloroflexota bacterium]